MFLSGKSNTMFYTEVYAIYIYAIKKMTNTLE